MTAHTKMRSVLVGAKPRGETNDNAANPAARPDSPAAAIELLNRAFDEFKEKNDQRLAEIEARGSDDVVTREHVDRINADVSELSQIVERGFAGIEAGLSSGAAGGGVSQPVRENQRAFDGFARGHIAANEYAATIQPGVQAAATSDSQTDGGYLVPDETESTIDRFLGQTSAMRGAARVIRIGGSVYKKNVTVSGASSGWVAEKQARPETGTPTLVEQKYPTHEIYAMPSATQTLLDDASVDISEWLAEEVRTEFAEQEGAAFVSGDGVDKPRGFTAYPTVANASWSWGKIGFTASGVALALTDASNNGVDALTDLVYSLKSQLRSNGRWMMNSLTTATVRKLKDANDGQYLWQPSIAAGEPATLLGYPAADDDNMADIAADAFPIAFGDFRRGYLIVDRIGIRILRDPYSAKPYIQFYTTKRVGGGVDHFEAIKLLKIAA